MTNILILDTSTDRGLVALANGEKLLFVQELPVGTKSSHFLASTLQTVFQQFPVDLDAVAVTVGPGSFTGIRVAVAAAKGVALGRSLPLIGLSSLSGFISPLEGRFGSVIDARVGGAYVMIQERSGEQIQELGLPRLVPLEELSELLEGCTAIVGPSFRKLALEGAVETTPDAAHLAKLASLRLIQGDISLNGHLDLHYFNHPFSK